MRRRCHALAGWACAAALAACGGASTPAPPECTASSTPFCRDPVAAAEVEAALVDATERAVPALAAPAARAAILPALQALLHELTASRPTGALQALQAARQAVATVTADPVTPAGDAPDLGVVSLTLDRVAVALGTT